MFSIIIFKENIFNVNEDFSRQWGLIGLGIND